MDAQILSLESQGSGVRQRIGASSMKSRLPSTPVGRRGGRERGERRGRGGGRESGEERGGGGREGRVRAFEYIHVHVLI